MFVIQTGSCVNSSSLNVRVLLCILRSLLVVTESHLGYSNIEISESFCKCNLQ